MVMGRKTDGIGVCFESPQRPLKAVMGGAKVFYKLGLVEHLLARVDAVLIGGGMAYTFLVALGHDVGRSLLEPDRVEAARAILGRARALCVRGRLPVDLVAAPGPDSVEGVRAVGGRGRPPDRMGLGVGS